VTLCVAPVGDIVADKTQVSPNLASVKSCLLRTMAVTLGAATGVTAGSVALGVGVLDCLGVLVAWIVGVGVA